jgi:hypothetical protein
LTLALLVSVAGRDGLTGVLSLPVAPSIRRVRNCGSAGGRG